MTTTDPLRYLATWLSPASVGITPEVLHSRKQTVEAIALEVGPIELVRTATSETASAGYELIEDRAAHFDETYVRGANGALVRLLANASVELLLASSDRSLAIKTALLIQSAAYLDLTPIIESTSQVAADITNEESKRSRGRVDFKPATAVQQKVIKTGVEPAGEEGVRIVNGLATRLEDVVRTFNERLILLDEEIDTLWWARSSFSYETGVEWSVMPPLKRAIQSSVELTRILSKFPATRAIVGLLNQVNSISSSETTTLGDIAQAANGINIDIPDDVGDFIPVSTAIKVGVEFELDSTEVRDSVLRTKYGLDAKQEVSLQRLPEQLLIEAALIASL